MADDLRLATNGKAKKRTTVSRPRLLDPVSRHVRPHAAGVSVRAALAAYLLARTDWRPATRVKATDHLTRFVAFTEAAHWPAVGDLTNTHLRGYLAHLNEPSPRTGQPRSAGYKNKVGALVRTFAGWLIAEGLATDDLTRNVRWPAAPRVADTLVPVPDDDLRRLLAACDTRAWHGVRDLAILMVLFDTGARLGELVAMRAGDVDDMARPGLRVTGKSGTRAVGMGSMARRAVRDYLHRCRHPAHPDHDALWVARDGAPLREKGVQLVLKRLQARAGIPGRLHPHKLRHTFALAYLRAGGDAFTLQSAMGHATMTMTQHYVHLSAADVEASMVQYSPADRLRGKAKR